MAIELTIEKMVYGGDGLARYTDPQHPQKGRGKAVLLPFVLEGERALAKVSEEKRGFMRGLPERIISASQHRTSPGCQYFSRCGGCQYQHSNYEHQLEMKSAILRETLLRTGGINWQHDIAIHASPPWNYRNRTRMKVQTSPFALGYYRFGSHALLPVEECPISSPLINRGTRSVWELGRAGKLAAFAEIGFFANAEDSSLLLEVNVPQAQVNDGALERTAQELCAGLPEIEGVVFFSIERDGSVRPVSAFGDKELTYRTRQASYRVSAGSFFQVNRFMTDEMVELMTAERRGDLAIDLYAGVGLFSVVLAGNFSRVAAVESSPVSFDDLQHNLPKNSSAHCATTEGFLQRIKADGSRPDYVIADPPRAGLGEKAAQSLLGLRARQLAYLSCDPATLARDLKVLTGGGYHIDAIHLLDLFPQTFHIESAVLLAR